MKENQKVQLIIICFCGLLMLACQKDRTVVIGPDAEKTLSNYVLRNSGDALSDKLIACAAGGQVGFLEDADYPISVFFYPITGATNFRYFETTTAQDERDDFSLYTEKELSVAPVFNGYLQRFKREIADHEVWGRVTFNTPDSLHISNAIRIKLPQKPTEYAPDSLQLDFSQPAMPLFSWEDGIIPENEIYFHVVSDAQSNLVSGTYTYDKFFRFYDLSNVVLNIRNVNPPPELQIGENYTFTLMGVSIDNWVNLIADSTFIVQ